MGRSVTTLPALDRTCQKGEGNGIEPLEPNQKSPITKTAMKVPVQEWIDNMYEKQREKAARKARRRKSLTSHDKNAAETNPDG